MSDGSTTSGAQAATSGSGGAGSGSTSTGATSTPTTSAATTTTSGTNVVTSGTGGSGGSSGGDTGSGGSGGIMSIADASDGARDAASDGSARDSTIVAPASDASTPSTGCGTAAGQTLATYVTKNTMSGGVARSYRLYLPTGYNPMRAYPLIVLGHGCGGNGGTPFPMEQASKSDAIIVALKSVADCFEYSPTGPDVTYFDTVVAEVEAATCVNQSRIFMAGFSSGSWLTHTIGCVRANVLRGQGNASGNQVGLSNCKGPIAAMFAHDVNDDQNSFAGAEKARDRILKSNGCGTDTMPYDYDGDPATPSTCVMYQGCMPGYPVVWCPTMAAAGRPTHNSQVPISTVGFWRFWSSL
jgi:polyhydroxybutyrate depolymerase